MRQVHPASERLFVDYVGQIIELVDGRSGEIRTAQVFVAVLGASNYTYVEATFTQRLFDWIAAHVRAYVDGEVANSEQVTAELYRARGDTKSAQEAEAKLAKTWVGDKSLLNISRL